MARIYEKIWKEKEGIIKEGRAATIALRRGVGDSVDIERACIFGYWFDSKSRYPKFQIRKKDLILIRKS